MAGTVNQKGYKKLPPAPIALSDDEVLKFKGLEEETDAMYEKYGEDYTGKGDDGIDLIDQYEGYRVGNMVKILDGNFKGEDGEVRRLKDEMIMVRLFTYGSVLDQWFRPKDIRIWRLFLPRRHWVCPNCIHRYVVVANNIRFTYVELC